MKKFTNMIKAAQKEYDLTEEDMWESVAIMDEVMEKVGETNPELVSKMTIKYVGILYKGHFPIDFAEEVVAGLFSKSSDGRKYYGKHWTLEQIDETAKAKGIRFPSDTTEGDKLYAFNSFWHDVQYSGAEEEKIFEEAYLFYFADDDYGGQWGKPFRYFKAMKE